MHRSPWSPFPSLREPIQLHSPTHSRRPRRGRGTSHLILVLLLLWLFSIVPDQIGITAAGCEGRKNTLAPQVLAYKKEAQEFFPELCMAAMEPCQADSLFPVKPASSPERHRAHVMRKTSQEVRSLSMSSNNVIDSKGWLLCTSPVGDLLYLSSRRHTQACVRFTFRTFLRTFQCITEVQTSASSLTY